MFPSRSSYAIARPLEPLQALWAGLLLVFAVVGCEKQPVTMELSGPLNAPWLEQTPGVETVEVVDHRESISIDAMASKDEPVTVAPLRDLDWPSKPTTLVLTEGDSDEESGPSASDLGRVEIVPTPVATPELVAEIVPTPVGMPENSLARMRRPPMIDRKTPQDLDVEAAGKKKKLDLSMPAYPDNGDLAEASLGPAKAVPGTSAPAVVSSTEAPKDAIVKKDGVAAVASTVGMNLTAPPDHREWPIPDVTLFVTGQQHGYIEPCGCTGLENQKGGVARRMTFMSDLRDLGWNLVPIDAGNQVRRFVKQSEIKYHRTLEALRKMGYAAVGFGPDDVRLNVGELILEAAEDGNPERSVYASANVVLLDPSLMPTHRILTSNGMKIGVTSILSPESIEGKLSEDITIADPVGAAKDALLAIQTESPNYTVLTYYGEEEAAQELVRQVPGFDLIVVAGGYGEPTFQPQEIEGSSTKMILTGNKGMYAGLVGLYRDEPMRYARVPLTHEFADAPEMRALMAEYQDELRNIGLEGLGVQTIPHPSGNEFVGSEACGKCHTTAYDIWEGSMHAQATEHLVNPGERSDIARHFDPECLSCHVTGWNPQNYYPYASGYLELEASKHLHGNGCENCHGPGSAHAAAEAVDSGVSEEKRDELRLAMQLPLDKARETCMQCHDLDNSPDFHEEGAFDEYWAEVEHYGVD